jgi:hypothetical protein
MLCKYNLDLAWGHRLEEIVKRIDRAERSRRSHLLLLQTRKMGSSAIFLQLFDFLSTSRYNKGSHTSIIICI